MGQAFKQNWLVLLNVVILAAQVLTSGYIIKFKME